MAAKKGKSTKAKSLKSKHLRADQAGQVKGGLLPAVNQRGVLDKHSPISAALSRGAAWK